MEQNRHYQIMMMPKLPRWYGVVSVTAIFAAMGIAIWRTDSIWWYLPLLVAITIAGFAWLRLHQFVSCPRCSKRLKPRKIVEHYRPAGSRRFLYDCHHCQITWDSQYVEEPMTLP